MGGSASGEEVWGQSRIEHPEIGTKKIDLDPIFYAVPPSKAGLLDLLALAADRVP
jgi:hypothetical protein